MDTGKVRIQRQDEESGQHGFHARLDGDTITVVQTFYDDRDPSKVEIPRELAPLVAKVLELLASNGPDAPYHMSDDRAQEFLDDLAATLDGPIPKRPSKNDGK